MDLGLKIFKAITYFSCVFFGVLCIVFLLIREPLVKIFTNDEELIELTSNVLIISFIGQFPDSIQLVFNGVIRGLGKQKIASIITVCVYYIIGLPLAGLLGFTAGLTVYGLQIAIRIACTIQLFAFLYVIMKSELYAKNRTASFLDRNKYSQGSFHEP